MVSIDEVKREATAIQKEQVLLERRIAALVKKSEDQDKKQESRLSLETDFDMIYAQPSTPVALREERKEETKSNSRSSSKKGAISSPKSARSSLK